MTHFIPRWSLVIGALALLGCGKDQPVAEHHATPSDAKLLDWSTSAVALNGAPTTFTAAGVCGSDTATYLSEFLNGGSPSTAKVQREWSDIVAGGKQIRVAGSIDTTHLGPQDLPMSHQLGDDLSMDVTLDAPFIPYSKHLGAMPGESGDDALHVEISSGYIPHAPREVFVAKTWGDMSAHNITGFQPGFGVPNKGDRALVQGRYIIDCGHGDYSTELHAISFLAFAASDAKKTTVRAYFNPYRDSESYNPDLALLGKVSDKARLTMTGTQPFPTFLVSELGRLIGGESQRLHSYGLLDETRASPADWIVCAPPGTSGTDLSVNYDFVTRSGVSITATPSLQNGCVTMHTVIGDAYKPLDLAMKPCSLPWAFLNKIAGDAVGNPSLDLPAQIVKLVGDQYKPLVDRDPEAACFDGLQGPLVTDAPAKQSVRVDDTQPFPFYGTVAVSWR